MYLNETSLLEVMKRQFIFKVRSYYGAFTSLATVQAIAILFSFNGVGQMGLGGDAINISISTFSGSLIYFFTIFWAFVTAITITTKPYHYIDFSFVTNRISSHLSTVGMLFVYSFIASMTAMFAGILLRVIMYFKSAQMIGDHYFLSFPDLLLGVYSGTLYIFLFAVFGYLIGMFAQLHKLLGFAFPAILIGWSIYEVRSFDSFTPYTFFALEPSILVFSLKVVFTTALLLVIVMAATNRLEVRK